MLTRKQLNAFCDSLIANAHRQSSYKLSSADGSKQCCLGHFCEFMNYPYKVVRDLTGRYYREYFNSAGCLLEDAKNLFGNETGYFEDLNMPPLRYNGKIYNDMSGANDSGVPWTVIADHLRTHYPCAEE